MKGNNSKLLFSTSQLSINVTIKSLEIPSTSPSCVFLIWYGKNGECGRSQLFRMIKGVVQIDKSFLIKASRLQNEFSTIQLKTKSIRGAINHLAEIVTSVPTDIFDGATNEASFEVKTDSGVFKVNIIFDVLPEEDITQPNLDIRETPNVTRYSALLKRLKPTIFKPEIASNFWGIEGFRYQIESLVNCRATEPAIGELESMNAQIHKIAKDTDFYSSFIQKTVLMLMGTPQYINNKNEVVTMTERKDYFANSPVYPVLAIHICNSIQQYTTVKKDLSYLEMPLVDICGLMAYQIADPSTDYPELIHVVAATSFVSAFLANKNRNDMETILNAFRVVEKDALHSILKKFNETIQQKCMLPSRIKMLITKNENIFNNAQVPKSIWEELKKYIFTSIDYYVASSWIAGAIEINFNFKKYTDNFPNAEFPYICSISKLAENPTRYLQSKSALKELTLKGEWLYQSLSKMNDEVEKKITEQQLLKLVKDPEDPTFITDIEYFIQNNKKIDAAEMSIPQKLPVLPSVPQ